MKLVVGGMVYYNGKVENLDILIEKEKIIGIGKFSTENKEIIDATGFLILPGGIDSHVHFNDPGFTHREDFESGSKASVSSGITTVIDMPCTSIPQVKDKESLYKKLDEIKNKSYVDYALYGGVTGDMIRDKKFKDIENLYSEGVVGFKIYSYSSAPYFEHLSYGEMYELFKYFKKEDILFTLHAEDYSITKHYMELAQKKEDLSEGEKWILARPYLAEVISILISSRLIKDTNLRLNITHISTSEGVKLVKERKDEGVKIFCETTPHHLLLTQDDLIKNPKLVKTSPPVRCYENRELMWKFLKEGFIDGVCSDHFSGEWENEKNKENIFEVAAGISGIDTIFPLIFSEGVMKGRISLSKFVEVMSENPAKIFKLYPRKGKIEIGFDADLVFIDLNRVWKIEGKNFYSKGKYTPFENWKIYGKVVKTMLRGEIVFDENKGFLVEKGFGRFLRRID
ncbi:MAG: dihydroorotase family protein [Caldisericia bacterium]|jgi:dihydropyrimidinase/allantoinase|nr:dihydroorotase family protein [Caldisericia bacterium]